MLEVKQIKYGKKTVPQSKTAERITIPKRYLTILTNNSQGIFLIKQFNELTLSNQIGQTQKWEGVNETFSTEHQLREYKRLSLHKEEKKSDRKKKKKKN